MMNYMICSMRYSRTLAKNYFRHSGAIASSRIGGPMRRDRYGSRCGYVGRRWILNLDASYLSYSGMLSKSLYSYIDSFSGTPIVV